MRFLPVVLALAVSPVLVVPAVLAASPSGSTAAQPTVSEIVAGVKSTYKSASSVRAEFTQVVRSKTMGTEDRQRGRISFEQPRKIRVEMGQPVTAVFVSDGRTLWSYSVKDKQVLETPEIGSGGMGISLEDLGRIDELYNIVLMPERSSKPGHTVQLTPRKPGAFKSLQLTVTKQKYVLQDLVLVDQMDNVTEMSFTGVRMNGDIPDSEFSFVAPPGVQVIKAGGR